MINLLNHLVEIPSAYPNEHAISTFLYEYLSSRGFSVSRVNISKNRYSILAEIGDSPTVAFLGHVDTVSIVDESKWKHDPYTLTMVGRRLYGLGSYDMKAGISAFIRAIMDSRMPAKIVLTVDEENISSGAWEVVRHHKRFFDGVELIVSAEPNFSLGEHSVTVGRAGRCVYTATHEGKEVHISKYKEGNDSINHMTRFCQDIYKYRDSLQKDIGSVVQVRSIQASSNGMSVCGNSTADIEAFLSPHDSIENMLKWLQNLDEDISISIFERQTPYLEGYENKKFRYKNEITSIIKTHTGKKISLDFRHSVADDNVLSTLSIPVITWGPSGGNAHAPNEYVLLSSLNKMKAMYQELLMNIN